MRKIYIYKRFERFWHWMQALLVFFLALTGFEIHSSYQLFGFEQAVAFHNFAAWAFIILIIFTIFWHFTTGEWKQYIPTLNFLKAQLNYYILGIFKGAPHPTKKTVYNKFNPLQRLIYLGLKVFGIPVMVISGLLFLFYRYPQGGEIKVIYIEGLEIVALIHTLGAFVLIAFVIAHIYLTTTGHTPLTAIKAMISGWEELDDDAVKELIEKRIIEAEQKIAIVDKSGKKVEDIVAEVIKERNLQQERPSLG